MAWTSGAGFAAVEPSVYNRQLWQPGETREHAGKSRLLGGNTLGFDGVAAFGSAFAIARKQTHSSNAAVLMCLYRHVDVVSLPRGPIAAAIRSEHTRLTGRAQVQHKKPCHGCAKALCRDPNVDIIVQQCQRTGWSPAKHRSTIGRSDDDYDRSVMYDVDLGQRCFCLHQSALVCLHDDA